MNVSPRGKGNIFGRDPHGAAVIEEPEGGRGPTFGMPQRNTRPIEEEKKQLLAPGIPATGFTKDH